MITENQKTEDKKGKFHIMDDGIFKRLGNQV